MKLNITLNVFLGEYKNRVLVPMHQKTLHPFIYKTYQGGRIVTLTHDMLRVLLYEWNDTNIVPSEATVAQYVRLLEANAWRPTASPLKINSNGMVDDGQKRMLAAYFLGMSLTNVLECGTPPEDFAVIDPAARKAGGIFAVQQARAIGERITPASTSLARRQMAVARQMMVNEVGGKKWCPLEVISFYTHHKTAIDFTVSKTSNGDGKQFKNPAFCGAAAVYLERQPNEARVFFESVVGGVNLQANTPALRLRNFLLTARSKSKGKEGTARQVQEYKTCRYFMNKNHEGGLTHNTCQADTWSF